MSGVGPWAKFGAAVPELLLQPRSPADAGERVRASLVPRRSKAAGRAEADGKRFASGFDVRYRIQAGHDGSARATSVNDPKRTQG